MDIGTSKTNSNFKFVIPISFRFKWLSVNIGQNVLIMLSLILNFINKKTLSLDLCFLNHHTLFIYMSNILSVNYKESDILKQNNK